MRAIFSRMDASLVWTWIVFGGSFSAVAVYLISSAARTALDRVQPIA